MTKDFNKKLAAIIKKSKFIAFKLPQVKKRKQLLEQLIKQPLSKQKEILTLILKADHDLLKIEKETKKIEKKGILMTNKFVKQAAKKEEKIEKEKNENEIKELMKEI